MMSLTSILKREKGRNNLKNWFKTNFPNPGLDNRPEIKILSTTSNAGEIGTAFDYLIRFYLERLNKKHIQCKKIWVADFGAIFLSLKINNTNGDYINIGYHNDKPVEKDSLRKLINSSYDEALKCHKRYLQDGDITNELIRSSIFLAKLDIMIRAGVIDANFDNIGEDEINELRQLLEIVPWEFFKSKNLCLLNPTFGQGSKLVGGADADMIIDNTLIEIKTTKRLEIKREDLNQLIGYYLLSILDRGNNDIHKRIENIAIYFARFGFFWKLPLSSFNKIESYFDLADEFEKLINNRTLDNRENGLIINDEIPCHNVGYTIDANDFKCPYCGSKDFIKNGISRTMEKLRYRCKSCKRQFSSEIDSDFDYECFNSTDWDEFIK